MCVCNAWCDRATKKKNQILIVNNDLNAITNETSVEQTIINYALFDTSHRSLMHHGLGHRKTKALSFTQTLCKYDFLNLWL